MSRDDWDDDWDDEVEQDPAVEAWEAEHGIGEEAFDEIAEAMERGDVESLARKLKEGLDPDASHEGMCLLSLAISGNHVDAARVLLDAGARLDPPGVGLLHEAAAFGTREALELLLERGVEVDSRNRTGETALHLAATTIMGDADGCVDELLRAGADPRAKDSSGRTPVDWARDEGKPAMVAKLTGGRDEAAIAEAEESGQAMEEGRAKAASILGALGEAVDSGSLRGAAGALTPKGGKTD